MCFFLFGYWLIWNDPAAKSFGRSDSYFPNIFATIKIRTAPPNPPPRRRYMREKPAAANMGISASATIISYFVFLSKENILFLIVRTLGP